MDNLSAHYDLHHRETKEMSVMCSITLHETGHWLLFCAINMNMEILFFSYCTT